MQNFTFKKLLALLRPNLRLIRLSGYLLLSLACILLLSLIVPLPQQEVASPLNSKAVAQVVPGGPTGIVGGVPPSLRGLVRYAQLRQNNAAVVTVPVNGIGNYVLYYKADVLGSNFDGLPPDIAQFVDPQSDTFITEGTYQVVYLDGFGNVVTNSTGCNGTLTSCVVTYSPTADFGNPNFYIQSFQIPDQPLNPPGAGIPSGPLGIYGVVTSAATGLPIPSASVFLFSANGAFIIGIPTNGNGFYSFYYTGTTEIRDFVLPGIYQVRVVAAGFNPNPASSSDINYNPAISVFPGEDEYFVSGAALQQNFSL